MIFGEKEETTISQAALELVNLTKTFGENTVLKNLCLKIEKGDIFGFLGNNGAGKTTTIRVIFGLIRPTKGFFHVFGFKCPLQITLAKRVMGGLVDIPAFYETLTGRENLEILTAFTGRTLPKSAVEEASRLVGIHDILDYPVRIYSNGQKRRLGIAQALVPHPRLIVLDEPTAGLDPEGVKSIRELIMDLNRRLNITVVLSSHVLSEVQKTCNRVSIIHYGSILKTAPVEELLFDASYQFKISTPEQAEKFFLEKNITYQTRNGYYILPISREEVPEMVREMGLRNIGIYEISPRQITLEEVFLQTVKGGKNEYPDT